MANIIPIKGLRYNKEKVSNLAAVVTPPYDVIDESAQARYYSEHPANVIRLELGLTFPQDTLENNRYSRAKQYLHKWIEDETLLVEDKPALYYYQQHFHLNDRKMIRNGFICGLQVEEYEQGNILPHEETLAKPKADRLQLMRATQANFSSIFGLFADTGKVIDQLLADFSKDQPADVDITDEAGEIHKIWVIKDNAVIDQIVSFMKDKKIYIADGHHRYETALEYAKIMKEQGVSGYDYVLTTLVNMYDEGLVVMPTHRLVGHMNSFKMAPFLKQLETLFKLERYKSKEPLAAFVEELAVRGKNSHVFGMYNSKDLYILTLKDATAAFAQLPADKSSAWKNLDVAILDNLILGNLLQIGEQERRNQEYLTYTRDEAWLIEQIDRKHYQLGFILNATGVDDIVAVADAQDKMPQKSTYFYPKLITGLIVNHFHD